MVDKSLISRKLERVETYVNQIHEKKDLGIKSFMADRDLQSIILLIIYRPFRRVSTSELTL